jgi:hypothetical protein
MFYFGTGQPITSHAIPVWTQQNTAGVTCTYDEVLRLSITDNRLVLNQNPTRTLSWDATNVGTTPATISSIEIFSKA